MTRLIIHIGTVKTGTTTVQRLLHGSEPELDRAGFLYPSDICWHNIAHHHLGLAARVAGGDEALDRELRDVERVVAGTDKTVIISSEWLFNARRDAAREIARLRRIADVRILAFVRRQDLLLESWYKYRIGSANLTLVSDEDLRLSISDVALAEPPPEPLDFRTPLEAWADAFGDEAVDLRVHGDGDSVTTFLDAIGFPAGERPPAPRRSNRSADNETVEAIRLARIGGCDAEAVRAIRKLAGKLPRGEGRRLLSRDEAAALVRRFEEDNAAIFERLLGAPTPFTAEAAAADHPGPHGLDESHLGEVIAALGKAAAKHLFRGGEESGGR